MPQPFTDRLIEAIFQKKAPCVVGLDTTFDHMPMDFLLDQGFSTESSREKKSEILFTYNKLIIDLIADLVPAIKANSCFYEIYGPAGIAVLERTAAYAKEKNLLVILDAKRADVGHTSDAYASAYLTKKSPYDALTVNPYLGDDSVEPFVKTADENGKGIFILVKTSNKGSAAFQDLQVDDEKVYQRVAAMVNGWSEYCIGESGYSGIGAVVGATWPEHAKDLRARMPRSLFLVPGYGAQGAGMDNVRACFNADHLGALVHSARAVIYPHLKDTSHQPLQDLVRKAAEAFVSEIRNAAGM